MLAFPAGNRSYLFHLSHQYTSSVFFTRHVNTLVCSVLLWSNNATTQQCWDYSFYTSSNWPKFCICHKPHPTRGETHGLQIAPPRMLMLPFFYTSGTSHTRHACVRLELWGRPFRLSLLASFFLPFGVAMKGTHSTQLRCHISLLS